MYLLLINIFVNSKIIFTTGCMYRMYKIYYGLIESKLLIILTNQDIL